MPAVQQQSEDIPDALISASHRLHYVHVEHISCDDGPSLKGV